MKKVFKQRKGKCVICNEPTNEKYMRGNTFYCMTHFEETSPKEKTNNAYQDLRQKNYEKFFGKGI